MHLAWQGGGEEEQYLERFRRTTKKTHSGCYEHNGSRIFRVEDRRAAVVAGVAHVVRLSAVLLSRTSARVTPAL